MRMNPLDSDRKAMADSYLQAQAAIKSDLEGVTPYNSVELSEDQERMMYLHPERALPGGTGDPGLGRQVQKQGMGADKYAKWNRDWVKKLYGV